MLGPSRSVSGTRLSQTIRRQLPWLRTKLSTRSATRGPTQRPLSAALATTPNLARSRPFSVFNFSRNTSWLQEHDVRGDPVLAAVTGATSGEEILDRLPLAADMEPAHLAFITSALIKVHYERNAAGITWLHRNVHVAHIQLLIEGRAGEFCRGVQEHPAFPGLCAAVEGCRGRFSTDQLAETLLSLLYLGTDRESPLVYSLLMELQARTGGTGTGYTGTGTGYTGTGTGYTGTGTGYLGNDTHIGIPGTGLSGTGTLGTGTPDRWGASPPGPSPVSIVGLANLSFVYLSLQPAQCHQVARTVLQHLTPYLSLPDTEWTPHILHCFCLAVINCSKLASRDMERRVMTKVASVLEANPEILQAPQDVATLLRLVRMSPTRRMAVTFTSILNAAMDGCLRLADAMEPAHVSEVARAMSFLRYINTEVEQKLETRAWELLNTDCNLRDVINLMSATRSRTRYNVKRTYLALLDRRLAEEDMDTILLTNLGEALRHFRHVPPNIMSKIQAAVVEKTDKLIAFPSRFARFYRFLFHNQFVDSEHKRTFQERLMRKALVNNMYGEAHGSAQVLSVLLKSTSQELPEPMFGAVMSAISRLPLKELSFMAMGPNQVQTEGCPSLQSQISLILGSIHNRILRSAHDLHDLENLYHMALSTVVHTKHRNPVLMETLLSMFPRRMRQLTPGDVVLIAEVFSKTAYYLPEVFEKLADYVITEQDTVETQVAIQILQALVKVNYCPENMAAFTEAMRGIYARNHGNVAHMLDISLNLAFLGVFLEDEIREIFTVGFIEKIDQHIQAFPETKSELELILMMLNRAVVISCPELDVPWFSSDFNHVQGLRRSENTSENQEMLDDIGRHLEDVLGGSQYYKKSVLSAYGHSISFFCAFDKENQPVAIEDLDSMNAYDIKERIAIVQLTPENYCCNVRRLGARRSQDIKELEIIGYKVIQVPHFDWNSTALADDISKLNYLHIKLFNQSLPSQILHQQSSQTL